MPSKSQIDKLGQRLRLGQASDSDLKDLNEYRHSFSAVYETVRRSIHDMLGLGPTGRQAKTTESITEKLRREPHMCLSRMQDIAGCRLTQISHKNSDLGRSLQLRWIIDVCL